MSWGPHRGQNSPPVALGTLRRRPLGCAAHRHIRLPRQTVIHLTSAVSLALIDRYLSPKSAEHEKVIEGNGHDPDGKPEPAKAAG